MQSNEQRDRVKQIGAAAALLALAGCGRSGAQVPPKPLIEGEITAAKALQLLYGNYDQQQKQSKQGEKYVMRLDEREVMMDGKRQYILFTVSNGYGLITCPLPCLGTMGIAMFEQQGKNWVLQVNQPKLCKDCDSNGDVVHGPSWQTIQWGEHAFGLLLTEDPGGCGYSARIQTLYGLANDGFQKIFKVKLFDSFIPGGCTPIEEPYNWEADLDFVPPGQNGHYDVEVTMTSKPSKKRLKDDLSIPAPGVYRYDGKTYRHVGTQLPLGEGN